MADNPTKTVLAAVSDVFFYVKLRDAVRPAGYGVERVRAQAEVLEKAVALMPVAVVLNMNDAALDAFQALKALKGDPVLRRIPILAFANHEEVDTWKRAKELGVTKIVSRNEFSARTRDLLTEVEQRSHENPPTA
ncbi:MAG: response regulator [Nitrospirales bacterium]